MLGAFIWNINLSLTSILYNVIVNYLQGTLTSIAPFQISLSQRGKWYFQELMIDQITFQEMNHSLTTRKVFARSFKPSRKLWTFKLGYKQFNLKPATQALSPPQKSAKMFLFLDIPWSIFSLVNQKSKVVHYI